MLQSSQISFEKYRAERSSELCAAVDITPRSVSAVFYDLALSRRYARAALCGEAVTADSVASQLTRLFMLAGREFGIAAACVKKVGFAAPVHITYYMEEMLSPTDLFLRPETELVYMPAISAQLSGRFTAALMALPAGDCFAGDFAGSLCLAKREGERFTCAAFPLVGAFSGTALESGMPAQRGAIDEVRREKDGTICYGVVADAQSVGVAPSAAVMTAAILLKTGSLDSDGILTDRDLFYIGEDFYISQSDLRAVQADKARSAAAIEVFARHTGGIGAGYLSGDVFSAGGMAAMLFLGAVPESLRKAGYAKNAAEQGVIRVLEDEKELERAAAIAASAEDITEDLLCEFDDLYIEKLNF